MFTRVFESVHESVYKSVYESVYESFYESVYESVYDNFVIAGQMTFLSGVLQPLIRFISVAFGADFFLLLVHVGELFIHLPIRLGDLVDGGCLTGAWYYLDGEYFAPCACLEQFLACLILGP